MVLQKRLEDLIYREQTSKIEDVKKRSHVEETHDVVQLSG